MALLDNFKQMLNEHSQTLHATEVLLEPTLHVAEHMVSVLKAGGKILTCGNGGSSCDAQHFSSELVNRFERERDPLAALALTTESATLTAIGNDYHYDLVFQKQIKALGQVGDCLLLFTTSGQSSNLIKAALAAKEKGITVVGMTGKNGGQLAQLDLLDWEIRIPSDRTARIQEMHLFIIHLLCFAIDEKILA